MGRSKIRAKEKKEQKIFSAGGLSFEKSGRSTRKNGPKNRAYGPFFGPFSGEGPDFEKKSPRQGLHEMASGGAPGRVEGLGLRSSVRGSRVEGFGFGVQG